MDVQQIAKVCHAKPRLQVILAQPGRVKNRVMSMLMPAGPALGLFRRWDYYCPAAVAVPYSDWYLDAHLAWIFSVSKVPSSR